MYIKEFPVDKKRTILDLGIYAAMSDEVMTDEEKSVLDKICAEMELKTDYTPVYSLDITLFALEKDFDEDEKKKIFIEIVSIVAADHVTEREGLFIRALQEKLSIPEEKYELAMSIAKDFLRVTSTLDKYLA